MYIFLYFSFYIPFTYGTCLCEGKLLRVRLIMKKLQNFNFLIKKLILVKTGSIHELPQDKKFYEQYILFDLDVLRFLLTFYTKKYIHCDRKSYTFH